jgi:hypothetical protein
LKENLVSCNSGIVRVCKEQSDEGLAVIEIDVPARSPASSSWGLMCPPH